MDNLPLEQVLRRVRHLVGAADAGNDGELLVRFAARREEEAFATLVRRHGPMVLGVCRGLLHDAHDAEDAFQATFLVLLRRAVALEQRPYLGSWLYGVAYRTALKARTTAARRRTRERKAAAMHPTEAGDRDPADRELTGALHEELGRLPAKYREPLVACYLQGQTTEEAARRLGCPRGTVLSRLARGRDLLRARLGHRGVALPAGALAAALAGSVSAAVPTALARATGKVGLALLTDRPVAVGPASLADTVLKEMTVVKLKTVVAVALAVGLLVGVGAGVVFYLAGGNAAPPLAPPPQGAPPDGKDRAGDPLPEGAVVRLGSVRFWADCGRVDAIAFASGGKRVVTFGRDRKVRLWDAGTGKEIRQFAGGSVTTPLPGVVYRAVASPDGKRLAFVGADGVNPDGTIHVHDADTGAEIGKIKAGGEIQPLAFSPDGKVLAAAGFVQDRKIRLYPVEGGKERGEIGDGQTVFVACTFSPDGKTLAGAEIGKTISLWDVGTGKAGLRLTGHGGQPLDFLLDVAFRADGKTLVSVGADRTVRTWDVAAGQETGHFAVGPGVRAFFAPGASHVAVVGRDNRVEVWDVAGGKKRRAWEGATVQHGRSDTDGFLATAFSPDGKVLALGGNPRLELRSLATGDELYPGHNDEVRAIAVSADGREVAADSSDRATRLWEAGTGRQLARIEEDRRSNFMVTRRIVFSADGKTLLLTDREVARYLDAATGKELRRVGLPDETSRGPLALSGDGRFVLAVGVSGRAWVVDAATGKEVCELTDDDNTGPWGILPSAAFSPDGKVLAVAYRWGSAEALPGQHRDEQVVKVWDAATGKRLARLASGGPVAVAPGGKTVATVGDAKPQGLDDRQRKPPPVRLWDVTTGKELHSFDTAPGAFGYEGLPLAFSPDGKVLATAGAGGAVHLWDATTGKAAGELKGAQGRVTALAFSADGKLLASGGTDTTVLLWTVSGAR